MPMLKVSELDANYIPVLKNSFEWALTLMKRGYRLTRAGWNGAGQYVAPLPGVLPVPAQSPQPKP